MPKDFEYEDILAIAESAYSLKTGRSWEYVPESNYETFSNLAGWAGVDTSDSDDGESDE